MDPAANMESVAPIMNALCGWINSLNVTDTVASVHDFSNGTVLEKVLHHIDPRHFSQPSIPISTQTDFESSCASLEESYNAVTTFLLKTCRQDPGRLPPPPDFRLIASGEGTEDLVNLLELVILAAFKGANRDVYAEEIQSLPIASQKLIYELIASHTSGDDEDEEQQDGNAVSEESSQPASGLDDDKRGLPIGFDADLAREERLLKLVAERKQAQQERQVYRDELDDLRDRYRSLQLSFDRTHEELKETKDRLQNLLSGGDRQAIFRSSHSEKDEQITELETKVAELQEANQVLNRSREIFRVKAEKTQSLQDDYDEIKQQNATLRNRVNALDKYRQKAEEGRNLEERNRALEAKVVDLQKQLKESDSSQVSKAELRRTNDEYRQLLSTIEQDRNEQHEMKMRIELQYHTLLAEHKESLEQLARQNATNEELESRLHEYEEGHTPTTPRPRAPESTSLSGYDDEFAQDEAKLSQDFAMADMDDQNHISETELRAIMAAMQAQAREAGTSGKSFGVAEEKKLADKIQRTRHTAMQLIQHTQKQSALIAELRLQLSLASTAHAQDRTGPPVVTSPAPASAASPSLQDQLEDTLRMNQQLQREMNLMASAWYDQSRRRMYNDASAVRGRPVPEPRSFLGKQRRIVEDVTIGKLLS